MQTIALALSALLIAAAPLVNAQVLRCTDPVSGKTTYSDTPCPTAAVAKQVLARRSAEEIQADQDRADEARLRKEQRDQRAAQLELQKAQTDYQRALTQNLEADTAAKNRAAADRSISLECIKAKRNIDVARSSTTTRVRQKAIEIDSLQRQVDLACLGPDAYAALERSRTPQRVEASVHSY